MGDWSVMVHRPFSNQGSITLAQYYQLAPVPLLPTLYPSLHWCQESRNCCLQTLVLHMLELGQVPHPCMIQSKKLQQSIPVYLYVCKFFLRVKNKLAYVLLVLDARATS